MKRLILATMAVLLVAGILGTVSAQDTCPTILDGAKTTDLLAGQKTDIGDVSVWNDANDIYVVYKITATGWYLTETHLDVQCDWTKIPQAPKIKNPIPGKFAYGESFAVTDHQTEWCEEIPMPDCDDPCKLAIAAHAAVVHVIPGCMDVSSDATTQVTKGNEPSATYPKNSVTVTGPWDSMGLYFPPSVPFTFPVAANWIWETSPVVDPINGNIVEFAKTFTIPGLPTSGSIYITADNGYELKVNGQFVGKAQLADSYRTDPLKNNIVWWYDTYPPDPASTGGAGPYGWQTVEKWDISSTLKTGVNTLEITGVNEYQNTDEYPGSIGTAESNPAGLKFSAQGLCYDVVDKQETAWGDGTWFTPKGNWGMWFSIPTCVD